MPFDALSQTLKNQEFCLSDVLAVVLAANLPKRQRHEMASALRTIARALNRPLERIPAAPRLLTARLDEIAPSAIGLISPQLEQCSLIGPQGSRLGAADIAGS